MNGVQLLPLFSFTYMRLKKSFPVPTKCLLETLKLPSELLQIPNQLHCKLSFLCGVYFSYLIPNQVKHNQLKGLIFSNYFKFWQLTFNLPFPWTDTISPLLSVVPLVVTGIQFTRTSPLLQPYVQHSYHI